MRDPHAFAAAPFGSRPDGWTANKRVTFCLALAASGSVTFAAASAGLSRKSAYALKKRDRAFAALWQRALAAARSASARVRRAPARTRRKGDKVEEMDSPREFSGRGDGLAAARAERDFFFRAIGMRISPQSPRRESERPIANG